MPRKSRRDPRKKPQLDLALVIGLKHMIRRMAECPRLDMLFGDLELIERYEKSARRRAIRHIRENTPPHELKLRLNHPKPRGPNPSVKLGKAIARLFTAGQPCPLCKRGLMEKRQDGRTGAKCSRCRYETSTITIKPQMGPVNKFLADLREHRILSEWHQINDPDPPLFNAKAA